MMRGSSSFSGTLCPAITAFGFKGLELVERRDPLKPALSVRLAEIGMDAIVDDVAGNDQSDRGDVQARGVSRIGSPRINRDKLVPLQLQIVSFERLGNQKAVRNLAGKKPTPEVVDPGRR